MRRTILLFLLLLAMSLPARAQSSIGITARWLDQHRAVVEWQQPAGIRLTCVDRLLPGSSAGGYFLGCLENLPAGAVRYELPGPPPADYTRFPAPGDVIAIEFDGVEAGRVRLPERHTVYLPMAIRSAGYQVYLPIIL